jgi:exopolysaccharide biosynthesis polyprenyl glycosylphosphotransferase
VISAFPNPEHYRPPKVDWARLIPGQSPVFGQKKPQQSVKPISRVGSQKFAISAQAQPSKRPLAAWLPGVVLSRSSERLLCSIAADYALVALNWLLIGALLVPLRQLFPHVWIFKFDQGSPVSLLGISIVHGALITLLGQYEGLYASSINMSGRAGILGKSVFWPTILLSAAYSMQGAPWGISALICASGVLHFGSLLAWRQYGQRQRHEASGESRNVLIIGSGRVGRRVASYFEEHPEAARNVYGFLDNDRRLGAGVVGRVGDLARLARTGFVDEVILAAPRDRNLALQVVREARRLRLDVGIIPELFGCTPAGEEIEQFDGLPVICLHAERLPGASLVVKRCVDVAGASFALALLSPLLAAIALLIKLDSRGTVFYRAPRAGRKGHLFRCYKFRTMVSNADDLKKTLRQENQRCGPFFKIQNDPRITRLGRFLRRYSLDELPQLWNVLKGDMSLVGPRPHTIDDYAAYDIEHLGRLDVTPGMTGLWQVTARRDPSFQRGIELDREYIRTWSLMADARILLRTFLAVVQGSGQ